MVARTPFRALPQISYEFVFSEIFAILKRFVIESHKTKTKIKELLHEATFPTTFNAVYYESIARKVAKYMLRAATYLATLRNVEA